MLSDRELAALTVVFGHGSDEASLALSKWLGRPTRVSVEQIEQVPLGQATEVLADEEGPICFCAMELSGSMGGQLILAFDDQSGLALADLLLGNALGTSTEWGEVERSAALETANIIGCAYLNSLARCGHEAGDAAEVLVPSPPRFARDFAESLMEFALMNQAIASDQVFLTRTEFRIADAPVNCNLLFIPSAECSATLPNMLVT